MGEIPVGGSAAPGLFRSSAGYALAGLLAALLLLGLACPRGPEQMSGAEQTMLAAARSLVHDRDFDFDDRDRERLVDLSHFERELHLVADGCAYS